jgi:hypothetical protein
MGHLGDEGVLLHLADRVGRMTIRAVGKPLVFAGVAGVVNALDVLLVDPPVTRRACGGYVVGIDG